jgi:hypothetical protein
MADNVQLTVTGTDGTIYTIAGTIAGATVTAKAPPPPVVIPPPVSLEPIIPANAVTIDMLPIKTWAVNHDAGTPGDANGTTTYPVTAPDGTANCREFQFTLINKGGVIYHANVMRDSSAFNTFCYEVEEYFVDPSNLACHEKDLEQVGPAVGSAKNALYVDMATQLNGHAGCLDITSSNPKGWHHTPVKCSPMALPKGVWIPTKRYVKNLDGKNVLYIGSNDNGTYSELNITVPSQPGGLWGEKGLNCQYQFDGNSPGSVTSVVYARKFLIHSWKS